MSTHDRGLGMSLISLAARRFQWVMIRALDVLGAIIGLGVSLPLMILAAVLVYCESPGPIFVRQIRTGRNGWPFFMYKLRTMRPDAEQSGVQWTVENDPRVLRVGRFLRRWNIDETPQFVNVILGDMSLVGPRPERPEIASLLARAIPGYSLRYLVRPGMTGWAQVNRLRGNTNLNARTRFDCYYVAHRSIAFNLYIMFKTLHPRGLVGAAWRAVQGLPLRLIRTSAIIVLCLIIAACAGTPPSKHASPPTNVRTPDQTPPSSPSPSIAAHGNYRIGPSDVVEVSVFEVEDLSSRETVSSDGFITLALLGPVKVAGLTERQAESAIAALYAKDLLQAPQVNVEIMEYVGRSVTVMGSVQKPGVYQLRGHTTLLQALAMAGGPGALANPDEIVLFRTLSDGSVVGYTISMRSITVGESADPEVVGDDRIIVSESGNLSFIQGLSNTLRGFIGFRYW